MVTRRRVLRTGLTTAAAVTGTGSALRPMLASGQPVDDARPPAPAGAVPADDSPAAPLFDSPLFDEIYRGRRIQGFDTRAESRVVLFIDGRLLEVMRRVDGSWISMANHFQPFRTPLATARGAVDVIGRAELSAMPERHHH